MSSMVEKVARAQWPEFDELPIDASQPKLARPRTFGMTQEVVLEKARAAIEAIFADDLLSRLDQRVEGITEWLGEEAPYVSSDQKHTQEHTVERAYWHYGYMIAIQDVLRAIRQEPMPSLEDK